MSMDFFYNLSSTQNAPFSKGSPIGRGPLWLKDWRPSLVLEHLLDEVPPVVCEGLVAPFSLGLPFAQVSKWPRVAFELRDFFDMGVSNDMGG